MKSPGREPFAKYTDAETFSRIVEMNSVSEMWESCQKEYGALTAVIDNGNSYTYAQLEEDAAALRTVIERKIGSKPARVGLYIPNSYDFVCSYLAVTTLGMTAVILPAQLPAQAVFGCAMKFGLSALIYFPALSENVTFAKERCPQLAFIESCERADEKTPAAAVEGSAPCAIMFTGGTTGKSKGALLSNTAVMQGTVNGCYGIKDVFYQRYLLVLPLSHVFGLIRNLMTSLYTGSTLYICRNNKDMFKDIAIFRPTILVLVPALAEMALTLSKKFKRNMLGDDLKTIICGAAMVPPYLIAEYDKIGVALLEGYGLTESANLVSGNPESLSNPDSVGIPYPNQELKIVDGELWLKGKNMFDCYVGEDETGVWEDGWFKTGDLARIDDDGYLYITGRCKEIIVLPNGENISPAEVELRFNTLTCIQDSQVFEDVTETGQHILALEVVPRLTELGNIPPEEMKSYVISKLEEINRTLPPFERVNRITVRDTDFERTPSMKIVRYKKCQ